MKGNEQVLAALNNLLSDELTAINQYMVHSEMCDNWRIAELHKKIEERAITEMKHAEKLIGRILFLEGIPIVSNLKKITIGADVEAQFHNDLALEHDAVKAYNEGIRLVLEDRLGTRLLIPRIPQSTGAYGAAVLARKAWGKRGGPATSPVV